MISAIITTYNRPNHLHAALLALSRQSIRPNEIIVADDGSDDSTQKVIEHFAASVKMPVAHVWQEHKNFRAAKSRNNALRVAAGRFIAFVDQDGLAHSNWLAQHSAFSKPGVFNIGGLLMLSEEASSALSEKTIVSGEFENFHLPEEQKRLAALQRKASMYSFLRKLGMGIKNKPRLDSGNFSACRADLEKVNGFDENYIGWGQEDDDLGRRLFTAGIRPRPVITSAKVTHIWHPRDRSAPAKWDRGSNIPYYQRRGVRAYCENGLHKPDGTDNDDVVVTRHNFD
jgi:glycosyltransferase involved in cell wall biosynthesis